MGYTIIIWTDDNEQYDYTEQYKIKPAKKPKRN